MKMIIHNGKRYRPEDAKRLGITDEPTKTAAKTKRRTSAKNKARQPEDEASGGD